MRRPPIRCRLGRADFPSRRYNVSSKRAEDSVRLLLRMISDGNAGTEWDVYYPASFHNRDCRLFDIFATARGKRIFKLFKFLCSE